MMPEIAHESEHPVVQIAQLPTGRIFAVTEKRIYELNAANTWVPMKFEVAEEPAPPPAPPAPESPSSSLLTPVKEEAAHA